MYVVQENIRFGIQHRTDFPFVGHWSLSKEGGHYEQVLLVVEGQARLPIPTSFFVASNKNILENGKFTLVRGLG